MQPRRQERGDAETKQDDTADEDGLLVDAALDRCEAASNHQRAQSPPFVVGPTDRHGDVVVLGERLVRRQAGGAPLFMVEVVSQQYRVSVPKTGGGDALVV